MNTSEAIIKGLECHEKRNCLECPFWQNGCSKSLFNMTKGFMLKQDKQLNEWRESYYNAYGNGAKALAEKIKAVDGNEWLETCCEDGVFRREFRRDWFEERVDYLVRKLLEENK